MHSVSCLSPYQVRLQLNQMVFKLVGFSSLYKIFARQCLSEFTLQLENLAVQLLLVIDLLLVELGDLVTEISKCVSWEKGNKNNLFRE